MTHLTVLLLSLAVIATMLGAVLGLVLPPPVVRRRVLWTLRCRRGRRCANMQIVDAPQWHPSSGLDELDEAAATATLEWVCAGCGTSYRRSAIVSAAGVTHADREILL